MKTTLSIEYIGEAQDARLALYGKIINQVADGLGNKVIGNIRPRKPWVAEITDIDAKYGFKRQFLTGNWQRKRSNSTGSRGVEIWFVLESGKLYEVKSPESWRSIDRYFCTITKSGEIVRLTETDARKWLKNH